MENLSLDVLEYLCTFIKKNNVKFRLLLTCSYLIKTKVYFTEMIMLKKIIRSQWFDRFTNIYVGKHFNTLPIAVTHLIIGSHVANYDGNKVPTTVTHLTFGMNFDKPINYIPDSVTHLNFGKNFNRMPGRDFKIPYSVTHLKFGKRFNRALEQNIPLSVIELSFGKDIEHIMNEHIPKTVKKLIYRGQKLDRYILYYANFLWINPECKIHFPYHKFSIDMGFWYPKCISNDTRVNYEMVMGRPIFPTDFAQILGRAVHY